MSAPGDSTEDSTDGSESRVDLKGQENIASLGNGTLQKRMPSLLLKSGHIEDLSPRGSKSVRFADESDGVLAQEFLVESYKKVREDFQYCPRLINSIT